MRDILAKITYLKLCIWIVLTEIKTVHSYNLNVPDQFKYKNIEH